MTKIVVGTDCGNSPKMKFLRDFNIAFAQADMASLMDCVAEDIVWNMVGDRQIEGKVAFADAAAQMQTLNVVQLTIDSVMSHGKAGAVNGELVLADGQTIAFCDVYEFSSAKGSSLKTITSYTIVLGG